MTMMDLIVRLLVRSLKQNINIKNLKDYYVLVLFVISGMTEGILKERRNAQ